MYNTRGIIHAGKASEVIVSNRPLVIACSVALLAGYVAVGGQTPPAQTAQTPTFQTQVTYVQVDAIVTDQQGFMQQNKHIIPWKCHVCSRQFDTTSGGICKECGKPTCHICFGLGELKSFGKLKVPEIRICRSCTDKKVTKPS